jgi:chromosome segregation ATPase
MTQDNRPYELPASKSPTPPDLTDPNERLKQLQIDLGQQQSRRDHIAKELDELQADITDLQNTVNEVHTTLTDYGNGLKGMQTDLHSLQYFYEQKAKMVAAAIGDKKDPIDDAIQSFDRETEKMEDHLSELGRRRDAAQDEFAKADAIQADRQADYDAAKNYKQDTEARLTDLKALRTSITTADDATDVATMYFLTLEFKEVLKDTRLVSQHQLAHDLKEKLSLLEAAKEEARNKKSAWNELQTTYDAHNATLQTRVAGRRANLLAAIQAMYPVESTPAK